MENSSTCSDSCDEKLTQLNLSENEDQQLREFAAKLEQNRISDFKLYKWFDYEESPGHTLKHDFAFYDFFCKRKRQNGKFNDADDDNAKNDNEEILNMYKNTVAKLSKLIDDKFSKLKQTGRESKDDKFRLNMLKFENDLDNTKKYIDDKYDVLLKFFDKDKTVLFPFDCNATKKNWIM